MVQPDSFELPPLPYDLVISHPVLAQIIASGYFLLFLLCLLAVSLAVYCSRKWKTAIGSFAGVIGIVAVLLILAHLVAAPFIRKARNPTSSTIIAGIIDDKAIRHSWPARGYYIVVDINGKKYGVKTTKEIFMMKQYRKHSPFDYSLYTYLDDGTYTLYRFCMPGLKLKPERGNLR